MKRAFSQVIYLLAIMTTWMQAESALAFVTTPAPAFSERSLLFAASGYRNRTSGALTNVGGNGNYWSSAANSQTNAYNLNFNSGGVYPLNGNNRANGFSVRCVRALNKPGRFILTHNYRMQLNRKELHKHVTKGYLDARCNERNKTTQLEFEYDLERNINDLTTKLWHREWRPNPLVCFIVDRNREVFAPQFPDRVVSHVLFNMTAPLFERTFIYDSYSCRLEKGTAFGIERYVHHIRSCTNNYQNDAYALYLDISGYFMSINKGILYNIICETLEQYKHQIYEGDKRWNDVLDFDFIDYLIRSIIFRNPVENCIVICDPHKWDNYPKHKSVFYAPLGTGLTIGDLTSQLFSNVYLNPFDHFVKRILLCRHYGRYVDDARIISTDKSFLQDCIGRIDEYLTDNLKLKLHPAKTRIINTRESTSFLGAHVRPHRIYIANNTVASFHRSIHKLEHWATSDEPTSLDEYYNALARLNSYLGLMNHYKCFRILNESFCNSPLNNIFDFTKGYQKAILKESVINQIQI